MSVVSGKIVLNLAEKGSYGVPAYDTCGGQLDIIVSILNAAQEMNSPVFIQAGIEEMEDYFGIEYFAEIVKKYSKKLTIPVVLNLDHAYKIEYIEKALNCGFTAVMFDGSRLSYEKNVKITKEVTSLAHRHNASAEAELGHVGGLEGLLEKIGEKQPTVEQKVFTDPKLACDFVRRTGVDALAVAIGNAHGFYKSPPKLDFERLREIKEKVKIPLVLHGTTGIPMDDVKKAIASGVRKMNFATQVRYVYFEGLKEHLKSNPEDLSVSVLKSGRVPLENMVREQLQQFGCAQLKKRKK